MGVKCLGPPKSLSCLGLVRARTQQDFDEILRGTKSELVLNRNSTVTISDKSVNPKKIPSTKTKY